MANFKFEGDISGLSARQLEYVGSVLEEIGFNNEKVLVSAVGKPGDGYVANIKRFSVEHSGETFKIVAKVASAVEAIRAQMNTNVIFQNEGFMYTSVLPKFTELEIEAGVPENDRLRYAACYGYLNEEPNEIILLEDLQESNFVMMDRHMSLTDNCVKLFLKSFAALHSCSYALKYQEPETYEAFKSNLVNMWETMKDLEQVKLFFTQMESNVLSILDSDKYKKLVKRYLPQFQATILKNIKIDAGSKYSVIQQGDSWTNNVLFRLEADNPVECCMIDYQISTHNTPVADLQYMIFNCTDYETRAKHYYDWIDYYHSELDKALANFGLKANFIYPRDQLDTDLRRYSKISFALSLMLANILMTEPDDAARVKEAMGGESGLDGLIEVSKLANMNKATVARVKVKVEGLINSFIEFGYL